MTHFIADIWDFCFPRYCLLCGKRLSMCEQAVCVGCLDSLPRTGAHDVAQNRIEQMFWGLLPIERATSLLYYTAAETHSIVHTTKYHRRPLVGEYVAYVLTKEIAASGFFDGIDMIIPMPIHWHRRLDRGYNQSEYIARGISRATGLPVQREAVRRIVDTESQTRLSHMARRENVKEAFSLIHPELVEGRHLLIVDDVITTGATVRQLGLELAKAAGVKLSVMSMALSDASIIV